MSGHADLCIRNVRPDDATKRFTCMTTNTLTGERKLSEAVSLSIKGIKINIDKHLNCVPLCLHFLPLGAMKTYTFVPYHYFGSKIMSV